MTIDQLIELSIELEVSKEFVELLHNKLSEESDSPETYLLTSKQT